MCDLHHRFAVRRWLPMRPVAWGHAEATYPVHIQAALRAVEHEVLKLAFEVGLHVQELEPKHLRVDHQRVGACGVHLFGSRS